MPLVRQQSFAGLLRLDGLNYFQLDGHGEPNLMDRELVQNPKKLATLYRSATIGINGTTMHSLAEDSAHENIEAAFEKLKELVGFPEVLSPNKGFLINGHGSQLRHAEPKWIFRSDCTEDEWSSACGEDADMVMFVASQEEAVACLAAVALGQGNPSVLGSQMSLLPLGLSYNLLSLQAGSELAALNQLPVDVANTTITEAVMGYLTPKEYSSFCASVVSYLLSQYGLGPVCKIARSGIPTESAPSADDYVQAFTAAVKDELNCSLEQLERAWRSNLQVVKFNKQSSFARGFGESEAVGVPGADPLGKEDRSHSPDKKAARAMSPTPSKRGGKWGAVRNVFKAIPIREKVDRAEPVGQDTLTSGDTDFVTGIAPDVLEEGEAWKDTQGYRDVKTARLSPKLWPSDVLPEQGTVPDKVVPFHVGLFAFVWMWRNKRTRLFMCLGCIFYEVVFLCVQSVLLVLIFDEWVDERPANFFKVSVGGGILLMGNVLDAYFTYLLRLLSPSAGDFTPVMRLALYKHVSHIRQGHLDTADQGELLQCVDDLLPHINENLSAVLNLTVHTISGAALVVLLCLYSANLMAAITLTLPLYTAYSVVKRPKVEQARDNEMDVASSMYAIARDNLRNSSLRRLLGLWMQFDIPLEGEALWWRRATFEHAREVAEQFRGLRFLGYLTQLVIVVVGGYLVASENVSIGVLFAFSILAQKLYNSVQQLGGIYWQLSGPGRGALLGMMPLVHHPEDPNDTADTLEPHAVLDIEVRNLSFSYPSVDPGSSSDAVLKSLNIKFPAGKKVGVVGRMSVGKSTLIKCLTRLYEPTSGRITVGGVSLLNLDLTRYISTMEQRNTVFRMSVFDNIAIGTRASQAQVEVAARQASLHADVLELAEGYATLLGPGVLTPGQEQRLNLARTLVRNCPIYVLDNPTSAQDVEYTSTIGSSIADLDYRDEGGRQLSATIIAVTHDLHLIRKWELVLVLSDGLAAEFGNPHDLVLKRGRFYEMFAQQEGLAATPGGGAHITPARLRQIWMFSNLTDAWLERVAATFIPRVCSVGELVFEQGQEADSCFVLVSGAVQETRVSDQMRGSQDNIRNVGLWQLGDVHGEDYLITNVSPSAIFKGRQVWSSSARTVMPSTVLLHLPRASFEYLLATDLVLGETIRETVRKVDNVRSPGSLELVWPFVGLGHAALAKLAANFSVRISEADTTLFRYPNDPCRSLYILASGGVNIMMKPPVGKGDPVVARLAPMQSFGEEGLIEAAERLLCATASKQSIVLVLQNLRQMQSEMPSAVIWVKETIKYVGMFRTRDFLARNWLLGGADPMMLDHVGLVLQVSAAAEGSELPTDAMVILVRGTLLVGTVSSQTGEAVVYREITSTGEIVNELVLLDGDRAAGGAGGEVSPVELSYGERVVSIEVTSTSVVLTCSRNALFAALRPHRASISLGEMQLRAERRSFFRCLAGTEAMGLTFLREEDRLRLSQQSVGRVLRKDEILLPKPKPGQKQPEWVVVVLQGDAKVETSIGRRMVRAGTFLWTRSANDMMKRGLIALSQRTKEFEAGAPPRMVRGSGAGQGPAYIKVSLSKGSESGGAVSRSGSTTGQESLPSPRAGEDPESGLGEGGPPAGADKDSGAWRRNNGAMAGALVVHHVSGIQVQAFTDPVMQVKAENAETVVLVMDLAILAPKTAAVRKAAEERSVTRATMRREQRKVLKERRAEVKTLEIVLGIAQPFDAAATWRRAYKRLIINRAMGMMDCMDQMNAQQRSDTAGSSGEEIEILVARLDTLRETIKKRRKWLGQLLVAWRGAGFLGNQSRFRQLADKLVQHDANRQSGGALKAQDQVDDADLSLERLETMQLHLQRLEALREKKLKARLDVLSELWDELEVSDGARESISARVELGRLNNSVFHMLDAEIVKRNREIIPRLTALRTRIKPLWEELQIERPDREPFLGPVQNPSLTLLRGYKAEEKRLQQLALTVRPILARLAPALIEAGGKLPPQAQFIPPPAQPPPEREAGHRNGHGASPEPQGGKGEPRAFRRQHSTAEVTRADHEGSIAARLKKDSFLGRSRTIATKAPPSHLHYGRQEPGEEEDEGGDDGGGAGGSAARGGSTYEVAPEEVNLALGEDPRPRDQSGREMDSRGSPARRSEASPPGQRGEKMSSSIRGRLQKTKGRGGADAIHTPPRAAHPPPEEPDTETRGARLRDLARSRASPASGSRASPEGERPERRRQSPERERPVGRRISPRQFRQSGDSFGGFGRVSDGQEGEGTRGGEGTQGGGSRGGRSREGQRERERGGGRRDVPPRADSRERRRYAEEPTTLSRRTVLPMKRR